MTNKGPKRPKVAKGMLAFNAACAALDVFFAQHVKQWPDHAVMERLHAYVSDQLDAINSDDVETALRFAHDAMVEEETLRIHAEHFWQEFGEPDGVKPWFAFRDDKKNPVFNRKAVLHVTRMDNSLAMAEAQASFTRSGAEVEVLTALGGWGIILVWITEPKKPTLRLAISARHVINEIVDLRKYYSEVPHKANKKPDDYPAPRPKGARRQVKIAGGRKKR